MTQRLNYRLEQTRHKRVTSLDRFILLALHHMDARRSSEASRE
jgi:hypothetical protein